MAAAASPASVPAPCARPLQQPGCGRLPVPASHCRQQPLGRVLSILHATSCPQDCQACTLCIPPQEELHPRTPSRYLNVSGDSGADRQVFYSFTESERQPRKDPLVLWLQGCAQGCTSYLLIFAGSKGGAGSVLLVCLLQGCPLLRRVLCGLVEAAAMACHSVIGLCLVACMSAMLRCYSPAAPAQMPTGQLCAAPCHNSQLACCAPLPFVLSCPQGARLLARRHRRLQAVGSFLLPAELSRHQQPEAGERQHELEEDSCLAVAALVISQLLWYPHPLLSPCRL